MRIVSTSPSTFPVVGPATLNVQVTSRNVGRDTLNNCVGYLNAKTKKFGFGRGVIRVSFTTNGGLCGNFIDQVINKTFKETPPIIGPKCVSIGDTVTYSVCSILSVNQNANIGQDSYLWNQRNGVLPLPITGLTPVYTSGDNSSVTFRVVSGFTGGTLSCKFGVCNGSPDSSRLVIGLKTLASSINVISNSIVLASGLANNGSVCVPTGAANNPISLSINTPGAYTFNWSSNNPSWSFSSATGTSVTLNANESGGIVYVTAVGGCDTRRDTFIINRTLTTPLLIRRTDTVSCIVPTSTLTFTVDNSGGTANLSNINFQWAAPAGWTINAPLNGPTVTMTANTTPIRAITGFVSAKSIGCSTDSVRLYVRVKPAKPTPIVGANCITVPSSPNYQVTPAVSGHTYFWSNTAAWTNVAQILPNNSITYNATSTGMPNTISVRDTALGGCFSDTAQLVINNAPGQPDSIRITGCWNVGTLDSVGAQTTTYASALTFAVVSPLGITYTWSISPTTGGSFATTTGNSVIFNANGRPGTYTITCTPSNSVCTPSSGTARTRTVQITANGAISRPGGFPSAFNDVLQVTGAISGSTYRWYRAPNVNLASPNTNFSYSFVNPSSGNSFQYFSEVTDPGANPATNNRLVCRTNLTQYSKNFFASRPAPVQSPSQTKQGIKDAVINPNPAKDAFTLVLPVSASNISVSIFNSQGALVKSQICNGGNNKFVTTDWASGKYLVKLADKNGQTATITVIIGK